MSGVNKAAECETVEGFGESAEYLDGILQQYAQLSKQYAGLSQNEILRKLDDKYGHEVVDRALQGSR